MKKTLKLVGLGMLAFTVVVAATIAIYILINNNKTYYIYDVRIVEPVSNSYYYIYTDSETRYTLKKNQVVYMTNANSNRFEIGVYAHTSTDTTNVELTTSNNDVAGITIRNGRCFVEYKKAGEAVITASLAGVSDKITVTVYDNVAENMIVFDDAYYGDNYKEYYPNRVISYADDNLYSYNYVVSNFENGEFSENINSDNLRVEYDRDIFQNVYINPNNQTLNIQCKSVITHVDEEGNETRTPVTNNNDSAIYIQSFSKRDNNESVVKNYVVTVHIVADTPQYLQILLSTTPDFKDESVYIYTQNYDGQEIDVANKDIVDEILANQKENTYLKANDEKEYYQVFFTDKVSTIYMKIRKIYTNGSIVYLNPLTIYENQEKYIEKEVPLEEGEEGEEGQETKIVYERYVERVEVNPFTLVASNDTNFTISKNQNYYVLRLNKDYFDENSEFVIDVSLDNYDLSKEFVFTYKSLTNDNVSYFYDYNDETGVYTYKYWDPRTEFDNVIYNTKGEIIGFSGDE